MDGYLSPVSLLILPPIRASARRNPAAMEEEPHFGLRAKRNLPGPGPAIRSDVAGFRVADARRALAGLPLPGAYRIAIRPLHYRTRPSLSGLCEFDVGRIVVRVPEPFRAFDELVYFRARRKRGEGMRFAWVAEKAPFRTRRDVIRFIYLHEWLHWYMREVLHRRAGAETACDRFALRNFRRRQVTVEDAIEALRGCRTQPLPLWEELAEAA